MIVTVMIWWLIINVINDNSINCIDENHIEDNNDSEGYETDSRSDNYNDVSNEDNDSQHW